MDQRFHFHVETWRCLDGHTWLDNVTIEGRDEPLSMLVAKPWAEPGFERGKIEGKAERPMERESALFRILANLEVDYDAIQGFADQYGLLYHDRIDGTSTYRGRHFRTQGTPWIDWRYNILALRHWVKVWDLICEDDSRGLLAYIQSLDDWAREIGAKDSDNPVPQFIGGTTGILESPARKRIEAAKYSLRYGLWESHLRTNLTVHLMYDQPPRDRFRFMLRGEDLLTAIWAQFAAAVADNKEYRQCETCGKPFELSPDVARTNRQYCSTPCRLKAYRKRMRQAARLHDQGKSFKDIAERLESDVKTVRGWIKQQEE